MIKFIINLLFGDVIRVRNELIKQRAKNGGRSIYVSKDDCPYEIERETRQKIKKYIDDRNAMWGILWKILENKN